MSGLRLVKGIHVGQHGCPDVRAGSSVAERLTQLRPHITPWRPCAGPGSAEALFVATVLHADADQTLTLTALTEDLDLDPVLEAIVIAAAELAARGTNPHPALIVGELAGRVPAPQIWVIANAVTELNRLIPKGTHPCA